MSKHKLLLADDSVTIQKVVNLTFADEGIEVIAVSDGDAAMQKFVESLPDLVMVDVNMPGADGYQICEMIKQDEETKHIPVILLVGSFEPFDEEEARRVGADDFLTKPFQSIRQLVNKVSGLLEGKKNSDFGDETVNSFDDVSETDAPVEVESDNLDSSTIQDFGDAAMDDDLIQTNQIGSLPADEAAKFQSPANHQSLAETEEVSGADGSDAAIADFLPQPQYVYEFAEEQEAFDEEKYSPTADFDQAKADLTKDFAGNETTKNSATDGDKPHESSLTTEDFSALMFDDFDLLELPQAIKFNEKEESRTLSAKQNTFDAASAVANLSPETVEAVAERVVEKLSDEVIEKIVREVISQLVRKK